MLEGLFWVNSLQVIINYNFFSFNILNCKKRIDKKVINWHENNVKKSNVPPIIQCRHCDSPICPLNKKTEKRLECKKESEGHKEQDGKEWAGQSKWLCVNRRLARKAACLKRECCVLMPHAIESSCWASGLPPHVLFAARLPGRPSDLLCLEAERRVEKSTHKTRGKKNRPALYGEILSVGDLNACTCVPGLQWKDTHVVNIIELFLFSNRLGYKRFVRKR